MAAFWPITASEHSRLPGGESHTLSLWREQPLLAGAAVGGFRPKADVAIEAR